MAFSLDGSLKITVGKEIGSSKQSSLITIKGKNKK